MNLSTDFKEFLKLLKEHDAKYLITGRKQDLADLEHLK